MPNIAKILKNQPKGTKLYSPLCGDCELVVVYDKTIVINPINENTVHILLNENGALYQYGECMLFPTKYDHNWDCYGITEGSFVHTTLGGVAIVDELKDKDQHVCYCKCICKQYDYFTTRNEYGILNVIYDRPATDDEKKRLLTAIEKHGYSWDEKTKKLTFIGKYVDYNYGINTSVKKAIESPWIPVNDKTRPLEKFQEVLAYNPKWVDADTCPNGIRIGFLAEEGFISATWNLEHDCYDTVYEEGDDYYKGNAFTVHEDKKHYLPNMPTHYMEIPECKKKLV